MILQVPTWHTLYTPPNVLHTNNYLRGTWRTMLADQAVNEGKIRRTDGSPFYFSFRDLPKKRKFLLT